VHQPDQRVVEHQMAYIVEGVEFPRPFRIRRFGHFGLNVKSMEAGLDFYCRLLGFDMTDTMEIRKVAPPGFLPDYVEDDRLPFLTNNSDHHALILAHPTLGPFIGDEAASPDITMSHFTWQVGSLKEVVDAQAYLVERGVTLHRTGRDMPGSNWHCYFRTPEGQVCELYYGMEQVGINGRSKPLPYYERRFEGEVPMPQISDFDEREAMKAQGISMEDGFERKEFGDERRYNVGGSMLRRPFKVTSIGPVALFVDDMEASVTYYRDVLGFRETERVKHGGHEFVFLRISNEHHSLKLYPIEARAMLGLSEHTRTVSMGMRVGSYQQLKDAVDWLKAEGVTFIEQPPELNPGIDYCAYALDPEGHCIQLHYYMEQLGWDGQRRPIELRRTVETPWPATIAALEDTYADQTFMGPLG
jgi:catechol 2,3-dioxygenase-like lactoylglutathione lyase family enzyme